MDENRRRKIVWTANQSDDDVNIVKKGTIEGNEDEILHSCDERTTASRDTSSKWPETHGANYVENLNIACDDRNEHGDNNVEDRKRDAADRPDHDLGVVGDGIGCKEL